MATIVRPDYIEAIKSRLAQDSDIVTMVSAASGWESGHSGNRIGRTRGQFWIMPSHAILVRPVPGGAGDYMADILQGLVDILCYGANEFQALRLWRTVDPVLHPSPSSKSSFTLNNCRIYHLTRDTDSPSVGSEPDSPGGWPRAACSYRVKYAGVSA